MSASMERRGKLHESGLSIHQPNEPHTADKDDEKNNDDSKGANRALFLVCLCVCVRKRERVRACVLAPVLVCTWLSI